MQFWTSGSSWRWLLVTLLLTIPTTWLYAGAAHSEDDEYDSYSSMAQGRVLYDPFERVNRYVFAFNMRIDNILLRPIASWYRDTMPSNARSAVDNLLTNISLPASMMNNVLQLNLHDALLNFWQFTINTVLGVGVHDVAKQIGLRTAHQTLGNTLAHYGIGPGIYIVLPLIGSTTLRDISGIIAGDRINPLWYYITLDREARIGKATLIVINKRAQILEFTDSLDKQPGDLYITLRSMYHQHREHAVHYPQRKIKK